MNEPCVFGLVNYKKKQTIFHRTTQFIIPSFRTISTNVNVSMPAVMLYIIQVSIDPSDH